ncbi:hypothetical protein [Flavivirga aquatica]|uniref:hypothetical protein n=1 Tax=Flavivirga aquatica TaxID=1849968 RepID=UPI0013F4CE06|nr:hypothetical protein [Flavivirga aquatica]
MFASLVFTSCNSDDDSGDAGSSASGVEMITDSDGLAIKFVLDCLWFYQTIN